MKKFCYIIFFTFLKHLRNFQISGKLISRLWLVGFCMYILKDYRFCWKDYLVKTINFFVQLTNGYIKVSNNFDTCVININIESQSGTELIHEADPLSRPVMIIVFAHDVRSYVSPYVPTFQNKTNYKWKPWSLLSRLWVWPSGSLMTSLLY